MEDAVDALKMAFSVFAFIIALSIVFAMFAQAREVSDIVLAHTDNTYFVEYADVNDEVKKVSLRLFDKVAYSGRFASTVMRRLFLQQMRQSNMGISDLKH